ncbi:MAG: hypothetical protein LBR19_07395, partial [Bifidobacteriaceae bacterium]|nr:hypothetical protein [Bifidobacteriaceae bacterium]
MRYVTLIQADPQTVAADAVLVPAFQGQAPVGVAQAVDPETLAALGFEGKAGQVVRLATSGLEGEWAAPVLAVVGLGPVPAGAAGNAGAAGEAPEGDAAGPQPSTDALRIAAAVGVRALAGAGIAGLVFGFDQPEQVHAIALGARLGAYQFTAYRQPDKLAPARLVLAVKEQRTKAQEDQINRATSIAHAVRDARDLVNT